MHTARTKNHTCYIQRLLPIDYSTQDAQLTPLVTIKQVRAAGQQTCLNKHRPQVLLHLFTQLSQIAGSKDSM
jgi:hypothetical protein